MTSISPVAITGASGYVGSRLANHLRACERPVRELARIPSAPGSPRFVLGEPVDAGSLEGAEILIHCAYDFGASSWDDLRRINIEGSLRLFEAARTAGVKRVIVISTLSAFPGCVSMYGRAKLEIEAGAGGGAIIVRPGLVHDERGPGGVVGALGRLAGRLPIVPLVGAGDQILHACHSDDLSALLERLCDAPDPPAAPIPAACAGGWPLREILRVMAAAKGRRPMFLPVPPALLLAGLRMAELSGVRSRLRRDSLVSLLNQNSAIDFAPLAALGVRFRDFSF